MRGFDEKVAHLVEGHVLAKVRFVLSPGLNRLQRYLCFKDPEYFGKLSPASVTTLEFQVGSLLGTSAPLSPQSIAWSCSS